jgi:hypothetical protein
LHASTAVGIGAAPNGTSAGSVSASETVAGPHFNIANATAHSGDDASTSDAFSALDESGAAIESTWTHAGPHQAEAGFEDPSLGWVSVRASLNGGSVSAIVLPDSAEASRALGAHMAGLNSHLAEKHLPIGPVTMESRPQWGADSGSNQGLQHNSMQNPGQQSQHDGAKDAWPVPQGANQPAGLAARDTAASTRAGGVRFASERSGAHISVIV